MPARVNVYCKGTVASVTAASLRKEIDLADLMTLAECLELPEGEEAAVRAMRPHLRVEASDGELGVAEVHWMPNRRTIQIHRVVDDARGHIDELLEQSLPSEQEDDSPGARRVREHLRASREIVYFALGVDGSRHLAATLTEVLAFHLAEVGDGLVYFYGREWASPHDRGRAVWISRRE